MAFENQRTDDTSAADGPKAVSRLRRLGTKTADKVRLALGRETKSGVAEARVLEDNIQRVASQKNGPTVFDEIGPSARPQNDPAQMRRQMAALGSERHRKDWREQVAQPSKPNLDNTHKTAGGQRDARLFSNQDAAYLSKQLKQSDTRRHGLVASVELKADLNSALGSAPPSRYDRSSVDEKPSFVRAERLERNRSNTAVR